MAQLKVQQKKSTIGCKANPSSPAGMPIIDAERQFGRMFTVPAIGATAVSDCTAASPGYWPRTAGSTSASTRRQPRSTKSLPTSRVAPSPNRTVDPVI